MADNHWPTVRTDMLEVRISSSDHILTNRIRLNGLPDSSCLCGVHAL